MKGSTVEMVASSWIDALGGLSRCEMRSVPPGLAKAGPGAGPMAAIALATTSPALQPIRSSLPRPVAIAARSGIVLLATLDGGMGLSKPCPNLWLLWFLQLWNIDGAA